MLWAVSTILCTACSQIDAEENANNRDTVFIKDTVFLSNSEAGINEFRHQQGDYFFDITHKGFRETLFIQVQRMADSVLVIDEKFPSIAMLENVYVRDLDKDDLLELYVVTKDGNAEFAYLAMFEIEGDSIEYGDISMLYGPHNFYFTDRQLIHEHWLESADGCCDYVGLEFTYFELINNRFKLVLKSDFIHRDKKIVNRSSSLK